MSHATTIARDGTERTGGNLTRRIGAMALSLAVGVAIGYTLVEAGGTDGSTQDDARVGADHAEFLRLNTTALEFAPAQQAAPAVAPSVAPVDHFTRINTIDLENLASAATVPTVDQHFLDWNIATFEGMAPIETPGVEPATGGGYDFMYWNVGSLEWPLPAYSQSAIGPR